MVVPTGTKDIFSTGTEDAYRVSLEKKTDGVVEMTTAYVERRGYSTVLGRKRGVLNLEFLPLFFIPPLHGPRGLFIAPLQVLATRV